MPYRGAVLILFLLALSIAAAAVTPQFWENFSQEDLLKGEFNHVSLAPDGRLYLAPAYDLVFDTGQPYIFSMVRDKAGNLYVGTGDEGKVFKIDPQGKGSLYFQSKELNIFAMALDASDTLYVGTSPDGKVYKISGPNQSAEFCDPETKYIWALIFDREGNLYIGTGGNGTIYKVNRKGEKSVFYACSDTHVVSLSQASGGNILAGTSPEGLIIEVAPDGKGFALMDTPLEEVHSVLSDRFGTIYAVASSSKGMHAKANAAPASKDAAASAASRAGVSLGSVVVVADKPKDDKTAQMSGAPSAIYSFTRDGGEETVYSFSDQMAYDAVFQNDGSLLVATGPKGRLLSIDTAKRVTVVTDSAEEDLTRLLNAGDITYIGASNQGKVYQLKIGEAGSGTYESDILDARTASSWGKISWRIDNPRGVQVELSTRTGNTKNADDSWSDWSPAYTNPGQQITSPRARYLQWRAVFKGRSQNSEDSPADLLQGVRIAYLQQNLRPQVKNIEVLPYGIELQKQPSLASQGLAPVTPEAAANGRALNAPRQRGRERTPLAPRRVLQPGAQSFTWTAADNNEDDLEYSIYFKGEGESEWKLLEEKLVDPFYTLQASRLADGSYRIKIVASDEPSNPHDKYLIGELVSTPFVMAEAVPEIEIKDSKVAGGKAEFEFRANVRTGRIASAEFSVDGGEWRLLFPVDGIADSSREDYRMATPLLSPGEHVIGIRASDGNGNTGTKREVIKIQ